MGSKIILAIDLWYFTNVYKFFLKDKIEENG
jgi:hypothetical protein